MFKKGDLITGKIGCPYSVTTSQSLCEVIEVLDPAYCGNDLNVRVVEHVSRWKHEIGETYLVESGYFKLWRPS